MSAPVKGRAVRSRRQRQLREARRRRLAVVVAIALVAIVTLLVTAFGGGDHPASAHPAPASASRLLPAGPPSPQVIAQFGALRLQLPDQPEPRDGDRLPRRRRRRARPDAARNPGERGAAQAALHKVVGGGYRAARAGTCSRAARARRPRRSTSAPPPERTSTRPSTARSSASASSSLERQVVRRADRHPARLGAVARRLRLAHRGRPVARRRRPVTAEGSKLGEVIDLSKRRAPGARPLHERRGQPRPARGQPGRDARRPLSLSLRPRPGGRA